MTRGRATIRTLAIAATLGVALVSASASSVDEAFHAYWNATSVPEAAKAAAAVVASG